MRKRKKINSVSVTRVLVFVFFLLTSGYVVSCSAQPGEGSQAKNITLPNTSGEKISLFSLKGKVVLIDFWASWCRPCRQTVPGLKKIYSQYHDKGFEIYGVSLDENREAWKTAVIQDQSSWIHVNDNNGTVANQWYISVIPTTFLLNKSGKIIAIDDEPKALDKKIEKLLKD